MLVMENVSKQYRHRGQWAAALDRVNLHIGAGEFVAVVGPSGSGKSTLLLMLGGMLSPSTGRVLLEGRSLYDLSSDQRARLRKQKVGFVFQTFNLLGYLTALENVEAALYLAGVAPELQRQRATELLRRVGLGRHLHHKPCELSVGQQQRVALARTLANDPPLILADEPTGNLDPDTGGQILDFLEQLHHEGKTLVMVTHDLRAARRAQRVVRLEEGRVLAAEPQAPHPLPPVRPRRHRRARAPGADGERSHFH